MERHESNEKLLKEDSIVTKILSDPSKLLDSPHFDSIKLNGILGSSTQEGFWRLYVDSRLDEFVELRENDIFRTEKENGKTTLYIKNGAKFFHVKIVSDKDYERYEDESAPGGFPNIIFAKPADGGGGIRNREAGDSPSERADREREARRREIRERKERRDKELREAFWEAVSVIDEMAPGLKDALKKVGVTVGLAVLGNTGTALVALLESEEIGPEDLNALAEACKLRMGDIQTECEKIQKQIDDLKRQEAKKAAEAMARADPIVGEALRQRDMLRRNPKDYLRNADEKMMRFEHDVERIRDVA